MGACFDRLRCEVFQDLFLSPMNTGFVRPAIAIVLTACGIETPYDFSIWRNDSNEIAIVLTACGIETADTSSALISRIIAIVLTACGIETYSCSNTLKKSAAPLQ